MSLLIGLIAVLVLLTGIITELGNHSAQEGMGSFIAAIIAWLIIIVLLVSQVVGIL